MRRQDLIQLDRDGNWRALLWLPGWEALNRFLNRQYWTRTWIIQEMVVATDLQIQCGAVSIPWKYVDDTMERLVFESEQSGSGLNPLFQPPAGYLRVNGLRNLRKRIERGHDLPLLETMTLSWFSQATDPRDKIFSLLSFTSDGPDLVPNPNYEDSVEGLFAMVTSAMFLKTKRLDLCCIKSPASVPSPDLPSWVPSWLEVGNKFMGWRLHSMMADLKANKKELTRKDLLAKEREWMKYDASENNPACIKYFGPGRMAFRGIIFDTINGLGAVLPYNHSTIQGPKSDYALQNPTSFRNAYGSTTKTYTAIWKSLVMDEGVSEAAARLLPKLWTLEGYQALIQIEPCLEKWLRLNERFVLGGKTLLQWVTLPRKKKYVGMGRPWLEGQLYPHHNKENTLHGFVEALDKVVRFDWRFLVTEKGYIGMAHPQARKGDKICLLAGCKTPVILREDQGRLQVVGEAYVHGIMHGEGWDEDQLRDLEMS